jgi:O-antigen/teichoic acid export membrane protein
MATLSQTAPSHPTPNRIVRGAFWTVIGFGGAQALRFAFNLILTRLLYPELFGLMALVFTVVTGISLFTEFGSLPIVVSDPRGGDPEFLNTVWTIQLARGFFLAVVFWLIARPVASFYRDPRLLWLIPVIGLSSIIAGFNATTLFVLRRRMEVRQLVILELGAQAISGAAMLVWARISPGLAALVAGTFVSAGVRLIWGHSMHPRSAHRLVLDRVALEVLFKLGRWLWVAAILAFLAAQIDRLILAKVLTLEMLGIYGVALAISELPRALLGALGSYIVFPAFSSWSALPRSEYQAKIRQFRWPLLAASGAVVAILTAGGDGFIRLLYDRRYNAAGWMLPLLAFGIWPSALYQTIEGALVTVGQPRYGAYANLCKIIFTAVGIPIGFLWGGTAGAVLVVALNDLPCWAPIGYGLWRERLHNFGQDLEATALVILALAILLLGRMLLGYGLPFHRLG